MIIAPRQSTTVKNNISNMKNTQSTSEKNFEDSIKRRISLSVLRRIHEKEDVSDEAFQLVITEAISEESACANMTLNEKRILARSVFNSMRRLDVLQPLMDDPLVTEIIGFDEKLVKRMNGCYQAIGARESCVYRASLF